VSDILAKICATKRDEKPHPFRKLAGWLRRRRG